jgi:hypothetical protein
MSFRAFGSAWSLDRFFFPNVAPGSAPAPVLRFKLWTVNCKLLI